MICQSPHYYEGPLHKNHVEMRTFVRVNNWREIIVGERSGWELVRGREVGMGIGGRTVDVNW